MGERERFRYPQQHQGTGDDLRFPQHWWGGEFLATAVIQPPSVTCLQMRDGSVQCFWARTERMNECQNVLVSFILKARRCPVVETISAHEMIFQSFFFF